MGGIDAELAPTLSTFWNKGRIVALNPANRVPLLVFCSRDECETSSGLALFLYILLD
jgi:hypothetical protein